MIFMEFLKHDTTVNSEKYCETLVKLIRVIQNKRRGMQSSTILLLHDKARPQTANHSCILLVSFSFLGSCILFNGRCFCICYTVQILPLMTITSFVMKNQLAIQRFDGDAKLREGVTQWLKFQVAEFYDKGISQLDYCYDKCINLFGDYVKKQFLSVNERTVGPCYNGLIGGRWSPL